MPSLSTADHRASPPRIRHSARLQRRARPRSSAISPRAAPARSRYIDDAGAYTYGELAERVNRCANALTALGLRPEERVLLCLLDTIDFPAVFLGAHQGGHRADRRRTRCSPTADYDYMLRDSRARALVVSAPLLAGVRAAARASIPHLRARHRVRRRAPSASADAHAFARRADGGGVAVVRAGRDDLRRRVLLALFVGLDRRAEGHGARALEPRSRPPSSTRSPCSAFARTTSSSRRRSSSSPTASATRSRFRSRSARRRC